MEDAKSQNLRHKSFESVFVKTIDKCVRSVHFVFEHKNKENKMDYGYQFREAQIASLKSVLKAVRTIIGLSAQEFGEMIGVTRQTINNLEAGKSQMTGTQFLAISAVIDFAIAEYPGLAGPINSLLVFSKENEQSYMQEQGVNYNLMSFFQSEDKSMQNKWLESFPVFTEMRSRHEPTGLQLSTVELVLKNYKLFASHDFFLHKHASDVLDEITPIIRRFENKLIMAVRSIEVLNEKITDDLDSDELETIRGGMGLINRLRKEGVIDFRGEDNDGPEEGLILSLFAKFRHDYKLALFSQDKQLIEDILQLNKMRSSEGYPIEICFINEDGVLELLEND